MPYATNRPTFSQLRRTLAGADIAHLEDDLLAEVLDASCDWVEDEAGTAFNGTISMGVSDVDADNERYRPGFERYDGNSSRGMSLRHRPATSIVAIRVKTPILGFVRDYTPAEVQLYRREGRVEVFTYKLALTELTLNQMDPQAWGTIFPPLPKNVHVKYTYGYPQYDEEADKTAYDAGWKGGPTVEFDGDVRDDQEQRHLGQLRRAAICDAAASILGQTAGLKVGVLASVSFDGFSQGINPAAYGPQVAACIEARDRLMARRKRPFHMATVG